MDKKILLEIRRIQEMMYGGEKNILSEAFINPIKGLDDIKKIFWTKGEDIIDLVDDFAKNSDDLPAGSLARDFMEGVEKSASYADDVVDAFADLERAIRNGTTMSDETLDLLYKGLMNSDSFVDEVVEQTIKDSNLEETFVKGISQTDEWSTIKEMGEEAVNEFKDGLKKLINDEVDLPSQVKDKLVKMVDETYKVADEVTNPYVSFSIKELKNIWNQKSPQIYRTAAKNLTDDDKYLLEAVFNSNIISVKEQKGLLNSVIPGWRDIYQAKKAYDKDVRSNTFTGKFKDYFFDTYIPKQNVNKDEYLAKILPWYKNSAANILWDSEVLFQFRASWISDWTKWIFKHLILKGAVPACVFLAGPIDCTNTVLDILDNVGKLAAEAVQSSNLEDYGGNILTYIDYFIDDTSQDLEVMIPGTDIIENTSFDNVTPPIVSGYDMEVVKQDGNDYLLELNEPRTYDYNGTIYTYNYVMFEMGMVLPESVTSNFYLISEDKILENFPSFKEWSDFNENNETHKKLKDKWTEQGLTDWTTLKDIKVSINGNKIKFTTAEGLKQEYILDNDGNFKSIKGGGKSVDSKTTYTDSPEGFIKWAKEVKNKNYPLNKVVSLGDSKYSYSNVIFLYKNGTFDFAPAEPSENN